ATNDAGLQMMIFGGYDPSLDTFKNELFYVDLQDQDNPSWNQVSTTRSPPKRADAAAVMTNEGRFWIFGGNGDGYIRIDDVWFINMKAGTPNWVEVLPITVSGSPSARQYHSGLLTQQGDIFFSGGKGDPGVLTDVWYLVGVAANATAATTTSASLHRLRPKSKPEVSQKPTEEMDLFDIPPAGDYAKGIQKILNSFLKAEARTRKVEEAREETDAKLEEFHRCLKEWHLKERSRHHDKVARFNLELEEQHKIKDEAFQEMKAAIAEPH
ncbi:unnamed protein product, partial [Symbiodinium microadriaticum]